MTISLPKTSTTDRILAALGKRRAVFIPDGGSRIMGIDVYAKAEKEPFLGALLRRRDQDLPEGWVYLDELMAFISNEMK